MAPRKAVKDAAEKTEEKKTTRAKKVKEPDVAIVLQFQGRNTDMNNLVEAVKFAYKADGHEDEIEKIELYVQPENGIAYYVVNGNNENKAVRF